MAKYWQQSTQWNLDRSIGQLCKLEFLDVSSNSLEGVITIIHMSNLSSLRFMDLSFNSLSFNFSSGWIPPFQLSPIKLAACSLGPHFPKWIQTQNRYVVLDMSNAGILGTIPDWFWDQSLKLNFLNLSHNHLTGMLPDLSMKFAGNPGIDLSSNSFQGPIPPLPPTLTSLILSENQFSGSISNLCATDTIDGGLEYVDLSDNKLFGEFPSCWMGWQKLTILNLADNNLSGRLPDSMDSECSIKSLHLRNNSFTGELPSSLKNCTGLSIIDLGDNELSGTIPEWLGDGQKYLTILSLRSNQFHGNLPSQLCNLPQVQILDLSQNSILRSIPKCLHNLTLMASKESLDAIITYLFPIALTDGRGGDAANFRDHALLVWKGVESEYKNTLGLVKSIDLSSNKLFGEIPEDITNLIGLVNLNLSRNRLTGPIPLKIGHIESLNALDLSKNLLRGEIPEIISELHSLGVLDLSSNKFSGKIPSNPRLQGYGASAYMGNPELCGPPLPNECPGEKLAEEPAIIDKDNKEGFITLGFYITAALGFIVGFWGVCATSVVNRAWRYAYFRFFEDVK